MSLYDLIMGETEEFFTREDWAALGRGEIMDEDIVAAMLAQGYEEVIDA